LLNTTWIQHTILNIRIHCLLCNHWWWWILQSIVPFQWCNIIVMFVLHHNLTWWWNFSHVTTFWNRGYMGYCWWLLLVRVLILIDYWIPGWTL
jgi:hypothetical protein